MTPGIAFLGICSVWIYSIACTFTPFVGKFFGWCEMQYCIKSKQHIHNCLFTSILGWGDYMAEGLLVTCTYDFLSPVSLPIFIL